MTVSHRAFAVQFYTLLAGDAPNRSIVKGHDSHGWHLEFSSRSVSFCRVEPDEHIRTHVVDAIRALPWVD